VRIEELSLQSYGAFSSRVLRLSGRAGLSVVYGPNEAGKSTCLTAALDFLFGIPHSSAHGGRFGYDKMRLDGILRTASGEALALRRRKGKAGRTLSQVDGTAVDEARLSALFGSFNRERYRALFALDHALLRSGGEALLRSDGDIGRLIVEAGGGLSELMPVIAELDRDADTHYAPRASKDRTFYKALAQLEAAERDIRDGTLTREQFEQAAQRVAELRAQIASLRAEEQGLREQVAETQRLLRVTPLFADLAGLEQRLAEEGAAPVPPPDFAVRVEAALLQRKAAEAALGQAQDELLVATSRAANVVADHALLAEAARFSVLDALRARYAVLAEDESALRRDLAIAEARLLHAVEGVPALMHGQPARFERGALDALGPLATRVETLAEKSRELALRVAEDGAEQARAEAQRDARRTRGVHLPFPLDLTPLTELSTQRAALSHTEASLTREDAGISAQVEALGFSSVESLGALIVPAADVLRGLIEDERRTEEQARQLAAERDKLEKRMEALRSKLTQHEGHGPLPTASALGSQRAVRDALWGGVRTSFLEITAPADPLLVRAQRQEQAERFEGALAAADALADGLASGAQRIADARLAEQSLAEHGRDDAQLGASLAALNAASQARRAQVLAGFVEVTGRPTGPVQLLAFVERRAELLAKAALLRERRENWLAAEAALAPRVSLLEYAESVLGLSPTDTALAPRLAAVQACARAHDASHTEHQRSEADEAARAPARVRRAKELACSGEELTQERARYAAALAALGLPDTTLPRDAAQLVQQLRERDELSATVTRMQASLAEIAEAEFGLKAMLSELQHLGGADHAVDAPAAVAQHLLARFEHAKAAHARQMALEETRLQCAQAVEARRRALADTDTTLEALAAEAGVAPPGLAACGARAARVHGLRQERSAQRVRISQAGDGRSVEALQGLLEESDPDALRVQLPRLHEALSARTLAADAALVELAHAETALGRFSAETSLNQRVASREAAAAELVLSAERYLTLRLTRELLTRAIDTVRKTQRAPLVARASALFALATEGAFAGLDTDVARDGEPVVFGVRGSGEAVQLSEMSDGTRDQLFLAFRLASVEHYCAVREPLPFIGDDLLVHFDDGRARATLGLLAELGRTTQVLLFTHHASVCDAVAPFVAAGSAEVVSLAAE
jgi:uncharacterized protein YhaN